MGRSVSYPTGALVAFTETPYDEPLCARCGEYEDECDCEDGFDPAPPEVDWDWIAEDLRDQFTALAPSANPADGWHGCEDRILARNGHAEFGFSEYCGLMAVWLVPRGDVDHPELAQAWIDRITPRFLTTFATLDRLGTMSNGEGVYQRRA